MKKSIGVIVGLMLAVSMCGTAFAKKHHHNNGKAPSNSQAGGLPALAAKVDALQIDVTTLESEVGTLQGQVSDLQGQNNWVVVDSSGNNVREYGERTPATVTPQGNGLFEVVFSKDMSDCAYNATLDDSLGALALGHISVSLDPSDSEDVEVQTYDAGQNPSNIGFDLYVSCP